jgi:hypothetical protein
MTFPSGLIAARAAKIAPLRLANTGGGRYLERQIILR